MTEEATVKPIKSVSKIWLIPLIALLIGAWMVYYQWDNQGPLITIEFESAVGLEANKTKIKTRNVDIGDVKSITLKKESDGVLVTARINKDAEHLMHKDNQFWVVTPRISINGISGLSTLLSGPYIEVSPGKSLSLTNEFKGLDEPPLTPAGTPGLFITLNSDDEFAYSPGDPVIYKGLTVGKIEDIFFNLEERIVYYNAFVEAPYHELISENTRFWDVSGVRLDLKSTGVTVKTGNFETLITNGVSFAVPDGMPNGGPIQQRAFFDIYPDYDEASAARFKEAVHYVIMISDTVRGLNVGAPVEYRGLQVGSVIAVDLQSPERDDLLDEGYKIPVLISVQPGRVGLPDNEIGLAQIREQTAIWLKKGFRASLKTGNLLTGAQFVDLQFYDDAEPAETERFLVYEVIPTVSDEFTQITQKVTDILDRLNNLPIEGFAVDAHEMVKEFTDTAVSFREASDAFDQLEEDLDTTVLVEGMNETLENLNLLLNDYNAESGAYQSIENTLRTLNRTMQDLKPLLLQLNNKPSSLIFSGAPVKQPHPIGKKGAEDNE
jgi:paraquat-inducible protein B